MGTRRVAGPGKLATRAPGRCQLASQRAGAAALLSSAATIAAIALLPAHASSAPPAITDNHHLRAAAITTEARACGAATEGVYVSTALSVALRIAGAERQGAEVTRAVETIESDQVLAEAVATDDLTTVRSEVLRLVFNGEHIVRLQILRGGQLLDDLGGALVLAPVSGSLRVGGRVVGTFVMSIQDDAGYQKLLERLVGADTVMSYQGRAVLSNIDFGGRPLPAQGTTVIGNVTYLVTSFSVGNYPEGELNVSFLLPEPAQTLAGQACGQVSADVLAGVAQRVYGETSTSQYWVGEGLAALAGTPALAAALAAGDNATVLRTVQSLVAGGGFARLRVVDDSGRVVADVGASVPLLAPVTRPLVDATGRTVGEAMFAVARAQAYVGITHSLVLGPVLVRAGTARLAGTFAGPAPLPSSGAITFAGVHYQVASFAAVEFPSTPARIYVLDPLNASTPARS